MRTDKIRKYFIPNIPYLFILWAFLKLGTAYRLAAGNDFAHISQYTCSQYSKVPVGKLCTTQHRINEDVVLSLVSEMLKAIAEYAKHDRAELVAYGNKNKFGKTVVALRNAFGI